MGVHLPVQGTWVHAPVWEDPTFCGTAGPVTMATEPACPEPVLHNGRVHSSERPVYQKKKKKEEELILFFRRKPNKTENH